MSACSREPISPGTASTQLPPRPTPPPHAPQHFYAKPKDRRTCEQSRPTHIARSASVTASTERQLGAEKAAVLSRPGDTSALSARVQETPRSRGRSLLRHRGRLVGRLGPVA